METAKAGLVNAAAMTNGEIEPGILPPLWIRKRFVTVVLMLGKEENLTTGELVKKYRPLLAAISERREIE